MTSSNYRKRFAICLCLLLLASACRSREPSGGAGTSAAPAPPTAAAATQAAVSEQRLRQVIQKAELSFEVASPSDALGRATHIAESLGGFVADSNSVASEHSALTEQVRLTLRVPVENFSKALRELRTLSAGGGSEQVSSDDVSEEWMDLDARLKTQRALETQFLEILKRAEKVEDALHVEREIATVRTEIERMEGRRRFLAREVALSTIQVSFNRQQPLISASWRAVRDSVREAGATSVNVSAYSLMFALRTVSIMLPLALLFGLPGLLSWKLYARWRRQRALAAQ
ncbi:MAG: DUF4349 domain-containing protein [Polyangiaceae bacterium]